jgi:hypothetical protein
MDEIALSRRHLLAGAALTVPYSCVVQAAEFIGPTTPAEREQRVFERRCDAARGGLNRKPPSLATNGDEDRYPDRRASFAKTLPHNDLGEVDPDAYRQWLAILASGDSEKFAAMPRDREAFERLNNPQATYAIDLFGADPAVLSLAPPPSFASQAMAAEMAELYWLALMRDVPFHDYEVHPLAIAAIADLRTVGLGQFTAATLFRGAAANERLGPFVSQFLWRDIPFGLKTIEQRYRVPSVGQSFVTTFVGWLACQRGARSHDEQPVRWRSAIHHKLPGAR